MTLYLIKLLIVTGATTILLRAFPFIAFNTGKRSPKAIGELGSLISPAAIAMLVGYCFCTYFDDFTFTEKLYGAAEWIAGLLVIVLHLLFKNPLLSIIAGTIAYMMLLQYWVLA